MVRKRRSITGCVALVAVFLAGCGECDVNALRRELRIKRDTAVLVCEIRGRRAREAATRAAIMSSTMALHSSQMSGRR
jgi:hypothetical protein